MTDVAVAQTALVAGTASVDILAGGTDIDTGEFAVIACANGESGLVIVFQEQDGASATCEFLAGDYPPASLSALGSDTVSLAANDVVAYVPEAGRHLQDNGTIRVLVTGGVMIFAFYMPTGYGG